MGKKFEILDHRDTPLGDLVLRRRSMHSLGGVDVYEVKLGNEFLMSSLFHEAEEALAHLPLGEHEATSADVAIGGLGLGYTALAALEHTKVRSLIVIDALDAVIEWHNKGLVPMGEQLAKDPRCRLVHDDFFKLAAASEGLDPEHPNRQFDAILVDIDHSPDHVLQPNNKSFYNTEGLSHLTRHLKPEGVFALWSNDLPSPNFLQTMSEVFRNCQSHIIEFHNPIQNRTSKNTIYTARKV